MRRQLQRAQAGVDRPQAVAVPSLRMAPEKRSRFRTVGDGSGIEQSDNFTREEIVLALRNRGLPLEALRYDITPTGMHYVLVHFDVPEVDAVSYRLEIGGLVDTPLTLTLDDVKSRPKVTLPVTMECAGNGRAWMSPRPVSQPWMGDAIGTAEWTGTPLAPLLRQAGLKPETKDIVFTGADQGVQGDEVQWYQRALTPEQASDELILAYAMNGQPLEPQHGFPLRLIVPGWYGMTSVKWLTHIEAIDYTFEGYQQAEAYRYQDADGTLGDPITTMRPRAMMSPPGIPDFMTRTRVVEAGRVTLTGRAWAGPDKIARVEVSADDGATWSDAALAEPAGQFAWQGWSFNWDAKPGRYVLCVRCTSSTGEMQPDELWNLQGMGNNAWQRVEVIVEEQLG
jgi:sulfane dehydrogenase subunit SoxC